MQLTDLQKSRLREACANLTSASLLLDELYNQINYDEDDDNAIDFAGEIINVNDIAFRLRKFIS